MTNRFNVLKPAIQDLRQRQVKVMLMALIVAVATVSTISIFADQLQRALLHSASVFLAADRQVVSRSGQPIPQPWILEAKKIGLDTAEQIQFTTMASTETAFQLVSVKAVSEAYPLRGQIDWQADSDELRISLQQGPKKGDVWLAPRLLNLLDVEVGDAITIGETDFHISGLIIREPDSGFSLWDLSPRIMMHLDDVAATNIIQVGSRVRYRLLLAGDNEVLETFYQNIQHQFTTDYRWVSPRESDALSDSLKRAERFLQLGGSLAVLLAVVAIAVASREYAMRQQDTVALLKTLGLGRSQILWRYVIRLLIWGFIGIVIGLAIAIPSAWLLATMMAKLIGQSVDFSLAARHVVIPTITAMAALFAFAFPPIGRLRQTPAMRVLRSLPVQNKQSLLQDIGIASIVMAGLLIVTVGDLKLVAVLMAVVIALMASLTIVGWLLMRLLSQLNIKKGAIHLALIALNRHRYAALSQMTVFAMTILLATTILLVRTSLIADWQAQLPEHAPNHFLLNISPNAVMQVEQFLDQYEIETSPMYPIVRGRLTHINGQLALDVARDPQNDELRRELNLTTAAQYPQDNQIVAGSWQTGHEAGISLEQSLAEALGVKLGDELTFTIGGETISHRITSLRTVEWGSMQPNFFIIFPNEKALLGLPSTYLTSFYLASDDKPILNDFVRQFPTISMLEVDHIIDRIQQIIVQVSRAIEAILLMILFAAITVMLAVVSATLPERQREGALLRTLGGQQAILSRATFIEFGLIGFIAGVLGIIVAEIALWLLQAQIFSGQFAWHWQVVGLIPLLSAVLLALLGRWQLTSVLQVSPMQLLRRLE